MSPKFRPPPWKRAEAMMSMLAFIVPAMVKAITTSMSSKRKIFFLSPSVLPTTLRWVSAECK